MLRVLVALAGGGIVAVISYLFVNGFAGGGVATAVTLPIALFAFGLFVWALG